MPNRVINPRFVRKDTGSGIQGCTARIDVDGGAVIVGKRLTPDELAAVADVAYANNSGIAADEIAVWVPDGVLEES